MLFNPTNASPPFFQVFHPDFHAVLGKDPSVRRIAINTTFASGFAYEAPVYNPPTDEIFFVSEVFPPESSFNHSNRMSKINLTVVEAAIVAEGTADINVPFETVSLSLNVPTSDLCFVPPASSLFPRPSKSQTGGLDH